MDRVTEFLETEFPDAEERAMLLGIAVAPTDKTAKLVYADWLDDRDDPRGEYIRLLVKNGRKKPTARMTELRKKCSGPWLSMMGELHQAFAALKKEVETRDEVARGWRPTVLTKFDRGLWDFHYFGDLSSYEGSEDNLLEVLAFVCEPYIASVLRSIRFDGHEDRGRSNGTLDIMLDPMTRNGMCFPYLESLATEQGSGVILCPRSEWNEAGEIARLLAACPRLVSLAVPSAPDAAFFAGPVHPLEVLDVYSGYDTQQFVSNLARSKRFPKLRILCYTDYCGCWERDREEPRRSTTVAHFEQLLRSPAMSKVETIELREVLLTPSQVQSLQRIRSKGVTISRSAYAWS